mmetsp:Transcript_29723/g.41840  ORF Transcript_29723/g.41840 Transcript_29723/m.41840 type:complete len:760 (-) Transcript_29723:149-2428(-)
MQLVAQNNNPPLSIAPFNNNETSFYQIIPSTYTTYQNLTDTISDGNWPENIELQGAVFFDVEWKNLQNSSLPSAITYTVVYNDSEVDDLFSSSHPSILLSQIQISTEVAMGQVLTGIKPNIKISTKPFPTPASNIASSIANWVLEQMLVYFATAPYFAIVLLSVVSEKEANIKLLLQMIGIQSGPYYLSLFTSHFLVYLVAITIMYGCGWIAGVGLFSKTPAGFMYLVLVSYGASLVSWGLGLSSLVGKVRSGFVVALVLFVMCMAFPLTTGIVEQYMLAMYDSRVMVGWFLVLLPPIHLTSINAMVESVIYYGATGDGSIPRDFTWSDLTHKHYGGITALDNLFFIWTNIFVWGFLAWYLDKVLKTSEDQRIYSWTFLFQPTFWSPKRGLKHSQLEAETLEFPEKEHLLKNSSINEVLKNDKGLLILNLGKTYKGKSEPALTGIYTSCQPGAALCFLGHNGAGKSTLQKILSGCTTVTEGDAFVCGLSVKYQIDEIRQMIGYCPQFDILWPELTAQEHLEFMQEFKCPDMNKDERKKQLTELLEAVNLQKIANNRVSTFSGGMKRRLSVAMSLVGNPRMLLLDEPTTGMDPRNKRSVWNLIENARNDRILFLATQNMEEAEMFTQRPDDKAVVLRKGQIVVADNTPNLKARFGEGYRLNLIVDEDKLDYVDEELTQNVLSGAKLIDKTSYRLLYYISSLEEEKVMEFFEYLQDQRHMQRRKHAESNSNNNQQDTVRQHIKDWSIYHCTLEDVFFKLEN